MPPPPPPPKKFLQKFLQAKPLPPPPPPINHFSNGPSVSWVPDDLYQKGFRFSFPEIILKIADDDLDSIIREWGSPSPGLSQKALKVQIKEVFNSYIVALVTSNVKKLTTICLSPVIIFIIFDSYTPCHYFCNLLYLE